MKLSAPIFKPHLMAKFVLISGCSGGGKSTLLLELEKRGFKVVREPGRRIVQEQKKRNGHALPWINMELFAERALQISKDDLARMTMEITDGTEFVFFDRGFIDAATGYEKVTGIPVSQTLADVPRYFEKVFLAPPWPEIYVTDEARKHKFEDAEDEYRLLHSAITALGYDIVLLPKKSVTERADFVVQQLAKSIKTIPKV